MSQGERMRRVNEGVREVVSSALSGEAGDEIGGFVTITDVRTSPDLRHATVYASVFGDPAERERVLAALEDLRIELQREIADRLRMKNTPILKFVSDDSAERATQVDDLIREEAEYFDERSG